MTTPISTLPLRVENFLRSIRRIFFSIIYYGNKRWCPVCESPSRKFHASGQPPRNEAWCTRCDALERHRFVWLFFRRMTDLFDGKEKKFLHVAPERCFESKFRSLLGKSYLTVDLLNEQVMEKMDITDIQYHDEYFDVIYCSHVLEHVIEDKKALREFYRTLKTSGWAVILVPITADKTLEDFSIVTPAERLKVYGQEDHVRRYGPDFKDRLIEAGFSVKVIIPSDIVEKKEIERMGLTSASGDIYYCRKGISS